MKRSSLPVIHIMRNTTRNTMSPKNMTDHAVLLVNGGESAVSLKGVAMNTARRDLATFAWNANLVALLVLNTIPGEQKVMEYGCGMAVGQPLWWKNAPLESLVVGMDGGATNRSSVSQKAINIITAR